MTIRVYPSTTPDAQAELHDVYGVTLGEWLDSHDLSRDKLHELPPHIEKNGKLINPEDWDSTFISQDDVVEIWMQPHGSAVKSIGSLLGSTFGLLLGWLMPSQRTQRRHDPGRGQSLETSNARANEPKLGQVVPELAGRHLRYPDYLTPPRRRFISPREQWIEFLACVGPGRYQILPEDIRIGDTKISAFGEFAEYQIFEPGQSVAGNSAHEHWHSVAEVGSTSSGTAGLELSIELQNVVNSDPDSYTFEGNAISRPTGAFPTGWGPGTVISINRSATRVYSVTKEPSPGNANIFTGDFSQLMPLSDGDTIQVSSSVVSGEYEARDVSLDSAGVGSIQLWSQSGTPPQYQPVSGFPSGDHTITFGRVHTRTIVSASAEIVTYSGESLHESTTPAIIRYSSGTTYGDWTALMAACPAGETTNTVELDFFFPQGLSRIEDDGTVVSRSVMTEVQYRDADAGGPFTSILRNYSAATLNQVGYTWQIGVPGIRPEIRVRRVGSINTSTQINDTVQWFGLKSKLSTLTSYPDWTTIAIRMRSGGSLGSGAENRVNLIATRILPRLVNGEWSAPTPTRDIASFVKYIASTIGYTDDDLDMDELARLNEIWRARNETVDYVFDETTVKEAIDICFGAGMAELTISDGRVKPVRDDVRTTFETEQGYSPQNMTKPLSRSFTARADDDPDGVEVEYIDQITWEPDVVRCFLPGDQGFKIEKIKLDGVVDRTRAWRIGMRYRSMQRYNRWEYSFSTELDAMNSEYLSYVPLLDDIPGYGQSSILEAIEEHESGALLHVSEPMRWVDGETHVVAYRRPDGTVAGPFPATMGADEYQIIADMPKPWPVVTLRHEPPHIYFGTIEKWCFPSLITSIRPTENGEQVNVTARNYDVRVYAYDNSSPPQD